MMLGGFRQYYETSPFRKSSRAVMHGTTDSNLQAESCVSGSGRYHAHYFLARYSLTYSSVGPPTGCGGGTGGRISVTLKQVGFKQLD